MSTNRIRPLPENPFYWEYRGKPVVLLGGSVEDNLFQVDGAVDHLDELAASGGNYVRCTLSSRDPGNRWPFLKDEGGRYDLEEKDPEYWRRLATFLRDCHERDIFVQIELWDRFDYARAPWKDNPLNPENCHEDFATASGLAPDYPQHPSKRENPFFRSIPAFDNNRAVLRVQHRLVDWLLEAALPFPNVLFCVSNETNEPERWSSYWADYLARRGHGHALGRAPVTEMCDPHQLDDPMHERVWKRPERYAFVEVSQGNHQRGSAHYEQLIRMRRRLHIRLLQRPMNAVKVYGADEGPHGSGRDGIERFWRALFAGAAAVRFHRPPSGHGLGETAKGHLRAARSLADRFPFPHSRPAPELIDPSSRAEAYAMTDARGRSAILLVSGRRLPLSVPPSGDGIEWLHCATGEWTPAVSGASLRPPMGEGPFVVVLQ